MDAQNAPAVIAECWLGMQAALTKLPDPIHIGPPHDDFRPQLHWARERILDQDVDLPIQALAYQVTLDIQILWTLACLIVVQPPGDGLTVEWMSMAADYVATNMTSKLRLLSQYLTK